MILKQKRKLPLKQCKLPDINYCAVEKLCHEIEENK